MEMRNARFPPPSLRVSRVVLGSRVFLKKNEIKTCLVSGWAAGHGLSSLREYSEIAVSQSEPMRYTAGENYLPGTNKQSVVLMRRRHAPCLRDFGNGLCSCIYCILFSAQNIGSGPMLSAHRCGLYHSGSGKRLTLFASWAFVSVHSGLPLTACICFLMWRTPGPSWPLSGTAEGCLSQTVLRGRSFL